MRAESRRSGLGSCVVMLPHSGCDRGRKPVSQSIRAQYDTTTAARSGKQVAITRGHRDRGPGSVRCWKAGAVQGESLKSKLEGHVGPLGRCQWPRLLFGP
ncbi:hypothetical protein GCM10011579_065520 [Streptomyces albiflavescens]|uniref:Uncharacterized protein n=1 Tax=Streptomyces albiflavescens TaxID=1623582 RepID=A0A918D7C3_9ACTN|nr:hypothetical protein GCM10011579_065520 [Streptomyces albiflavescens]